MTTPTNNEIPSSSVQDRLYNAEKFDEFMNSSNANFTDRKGISRWTLSGIRTAISNWMTSLSSSSGASSVGLLQGGTVQSAVDYVTPQMFVYSGETLGDGISDDSVFIQRAINYIESINSSTLTRAPRKELYFPAGKYYIKNTVVVTKGSTAWRGAGIYQTIFVPHPDANNDTLKYSYLFSFKNPSWVSNATRVITEVTLKDFSVVSDSSFLRPVFYLGGVGWDCYITNVGVWGALCSFYCEDLFDTTFTNLRIVKGGSAHNPSNAADVFTHQIIMKGVYDNCNACRFIAPHIEGNYNGAVSITGRSNNIIFTGMPKFELNSIGTASGAVYPVISLNGPLVESIKLENLFISHPASITAWFIESNSRNLSIKGGSFMSPSDTAGQTAKKWIRIHRDNWAGATVCSGATIDIDMMHVDGTGDVTDAPIKIENLCSIKIGAVRLVSPNRFFDCVAGCDIKITHLTNLGSVTPANQLGLFNITGSAIRASITVSDIAGSVTGLKYFNSDIPTATRRLSPINVFGRSAQNSILSLAEAGDTVGYDESVVWNASGTVANIGYGNTGKVIVVRCPDTSNCLIAGGNIFLTSGAVTAACTIVLKATNFSFRQGWMEISRINGV